MKARADRADAERAGAANQARVDWVDATRGIGIVLVVYAHALRGLVAADLYPASQSAMLQDRLIYTFHVPLFFFLAGLWVERAVRRGSGQFLRGKVVTIVWPYLLWSLAEGTITLAVAPATNTGMTPNDLLGILITPIHHYWFLYALFLCHLAAALTGVRLSLMAVLIIAAFLVPHEWYPIGVTAGVEMPFYVAGILLARLVPLNDVSGFRHKIAFALGAWLVFAGLVFVSGAYAHVPSRVADYALGFAGIAGTIGLGLLLSRVRPLIVLGGASMAIFVLHTLFSSGLRILFIKSGLEMHPLSLLVLVTLAGIVGPLAVYWFCRGRGLLTVAGLGSNRDGRLAPDGAGITTAAQ